MEVNQQHFLESREVKLYYRKWMPNHPKAIIVLLHGAGEHSGHYSHIGEQCIQSDVAMFAPDLRGFGRSEGPRGHINCFKDYVEDLQTFITFLHSNYDPIPVFLFGHSLGGLIVIRYCQTYAGQLKGVILSSPALGLRIRLPFPLESFIYFISRIKPQLRLNPYRWKEFLRKFRGFRPFFPENHFDLTQDPFATLEYTPRWFTEMLSGGIHALSEATKFRFPTLCLYDEKDPIVDPGLIQHFFDSIAIQDKKHLLFADGRHKCLHEGQGKNALDNIMTWINTRV